MLPACLPPPPPPWNSAAFFPLQWLNVLCLETTQNKQEQTRKVIPHGERESRTTRKGRKEKAAPSKRGNQRRKRGRQLHSRGATGTTAPEEEGGPPHYFVSLPTRVVLPSPPPPSFCVVLLSPPPSSVCGASFSSLFWVVRVSPLVWRCLPRAPLTFPEVSNLVFNYFILAHLYRWPSRKSNNEFIFEVMSGRLRCWPSRKWITWDPLFCLGHLCVDLPNNDFVLGRLRLWSSRIFTAEGGERGGGTVTVSLLLNLPQPPPLTFQEVKKKCSIIWFSSACTLNHPAVSWERRGGGGTETDSLQENNKTFKKEQKVTNRNRKLWIMFFF